MSGSSGVIRYRPRGVGIVRHRAGMRSCNAALSASGAAARWDNAGLPIALPSPMNEAVATTAYRTWMCVVCGFIYDEAEGPAGRRHRAGHALGRRARHLDLPGLRRDQGRFRDDGWSDARGRVASVRRRRAPLLSSTRRSRSEPASAASGLQLQVARQVLRARHGDGPACR